MIEYANCIKHDIDNITFHFYRGNVWGKYDYKVSDIKQEYMESFREESTSHFGEKYWPEISNKAEELYDKYDEQLAEAGKNIINSQKNIDSEIRESTDNNFEKLI